MALADAAVLIARKLRRPESVAQSLRAKGNALYALNEYAAAVAAARRGGPALRRGRPAARGRADPQHVHPAA